MDLYFGTGVEISFERQAYSFSQSLAGFVVVIALIGAAGMLIKQHGLTDRRNRLALIVTALVWAIGIPALLWLRFDYALSLPAGAA
ncbi:MAG: hypothetical protein Alpg2KO_05800 [Alphaproteobacteria bacterium]